MKKFEKRDEDIIDLGAASEVTLGEPGDVTEIDDQLPANAITD